MPKERTGREALNLNMPEGVKLQLRQQAAAVGLSMSGFIAEYVAQNRGAPGSSSGGDAVAQLVRLNDKLDIIIEILTGTNPRSERHT